MLKTLNPERGSKIYFICIELFYKILAILVHGAKCTINKAINKIKTLIQGKKTL